MRINHLLLTGAMLLAASLSISFPGSAQNANVPGGLTEQQKLELRQRLRDADTAEERAQIRQEYLEQLRRRDGGQSMEGRMRGQGSTQSGGMGKGGTGQQGMPMNQQQMPMDQREATEREDGEQPKIIPQGGKKEGQD